MRAGQEISARSHPAPPGDAALLRAMAAGDERAFTAFYLRHAAAVARVVHRLVGDQHLDDIVQETFLHAASRLGGLREAESARGWLTTIAVRRAHRLLRRQAWRRGALRMWRWFAPGAGDPRATAPIDDVREVLQGLDPVDRTAWTLHRAHGLSLVETAEACEVSVATVKRRIARAEARLQEQSNET